MGKDFLKLKTDMRKLCILIFCGGTAVTLLLGVRAYQDTIPINGYELPRNETGQGDYEEPLYAYMGEEKIPLKVVVEERMLTEAEAREKLEKAKLVLDEVLKGENESLSKVTTNLNFAETLEDLHVEIEWTEKLSEYFYPDGTIRENAEVLEPLELKAEAILNCQEEVCDYEACITLQPRNPEMASKLQELIHSSELQNSESYYLKLPDEYEGKKITWKKELDDTFIYFFVFVIGSVLALHIGQKKDTEDAKKARSEGLEKEYAAVISKFAMLLSAGLNVRNAWERIVLLDRTKHEDNKVIYQEMSWALKEMQKGVSELEVYEKFGNRVGLVHYKKLMALFISHKKRGGIHLQDAMKQEMLQAWEEQKRKVRQQGEKIGTKLLIPMMGMLAVVFIMILVPAFLSFQL